MHLQLFCVYLPVKLVFHQCITPYLYDCICNFLPCIYAHNLRCSCNSMPHLFENNGTMELSRTETRTYFSVKLQNQLVALRLLNTLQGRCVTSEAEAKQGHFPVRTREKHGRGLEWEELPPHFSVSFPYLPTPTRSRTVRSAHVWGCRPFTAFHLRAQSVPAFRWDGLGASIEFPLMPNGAQYAPLSGD
eukprot:COSAG02_NODE_7777_length_2850_cov_2.821156_1_plen_189_part_00